MRIQADGEFQEPPQLSSLPAFHRDGAYAGIASISRRSGNLKLTLTSLYNQFDHIFVYLNGYDTVPDWLDQPKITVFRSQDYLDLNATGKVYCAQYVDKGYYFTLDDDFIYPCNYVAHMVDTLKKYGNAVAACVHGSIFPPLIDYYYLRTSIFQYQQSLDTDRYVCLPGTGSLAVAAGRLPLHLANFLPQVMVDLTFAILLKSYGIPLISVRRPTNWMQNTDRDGLYQQFTKGQTHHSVYAKEFEPWGFDQYAPAILEVARAAGVHDDLDRAQGLYMDVDAIWCAKEGRVPPAWKESPSYFMRVAEFYRDIKAVQSEPDTTDPIEPHRNNPDRR